MKSKIRVIDDIEIQNFYITEDGKIGMDYFIKKEHEVEDDEE